MKTKENKGLIEHKSHIFILIMISIITKCYGIFSPSSIVFDEMYTIKIAKSYFSNTFKFDVHPPFTRLLMTFLGYCIGFDFNMEGYIGESYKQPYMRFTILRMISVFLQTFSLILTYKALCCSLKKTKSLLITLFFLFETAFNVHYGLIISDTYLHFYSVLMFYSFIKFYYTRKNYYLLILGISYSVSIATKLSAIFTIIPYLLWLLCDLYYMAIDKNRKLFFSINSTFVNIIYRIICFILLPVFVYLLSFYIHFKFQDSYSDDAEKFSLNFQGLFKNNLLEVSDKFLVDRSLVTMINKETKLYIKSEGKNYEKGSQHQIVYADLYKNENAIWQLIKIHYDGNSIDHFIKNGDYIKILNVLTGKYLRTDNVFAENSYENKFREVCCQGSITDENDDNHVWIIQSKSEKIKTRESVFSLLHPRTGLYLGVISTKNTKRNDVYSSVDGAHKFRYFLFEDNKIDKNYKNSIENDHINEKVYTYKKLPFFMMLYEYHCEMISENNKINGERIFASKPHEWIKSQKGILYWNSFYDDEIKKGGRILYLLGNKMNFIISGLALILPFIIIFNHAMFLRGFSKWSCPFIILIAVVQFYFNYLPFFLFSRELYLTHYLPAYYYALISGLFLVSYMGNKVLYIILTISFGIFYQNKGFIGFPVTSEWCHDQKLGEVCNTI